jgi:hypothetical protein
VANRLRKKQVANNNQEELTLTGLLMEGVYTHNPIIGE